MTNGEDLTFTIAPWDNIPPLSEEKDLAAFSFLLGLLSSFFSFLSSFFNIQSFYCTNSSREYQLK